MEFTVGEFLGFLKYVVAYVSGHGSREIRAAVAQQNSACHPGKRNRGDHQPHLPYVGRIPPAYSVVDHLCHNRRDSQLH